MLSKVGSGAALLELQDYIQRLRPIVEDTVTKLGNVRFREDPIGGRRYSRMTSIMSSAYKRHGAILGRALLERLKDCARLRVWTEDTFKLSQASLQQVLISPGIPALLGRQLPYGERETAIKVDILVYDESTGSLNAYNVKRGNGAYDGDKRRLMLEDTLRVHLLLDGYGRLCGLNPVSTHAHVIFYYDLLSISPPLAIAGSDLDRHFNFPVRGAMEQVNSLFRERLFEVVEMDD